MSLEWVAIVLTVFLFGIGWLSRQKDKKDFDISLKKHADDVLEKNVKLEKIKQSLKEKEGKLNFRPGKEPGDAKPVATRSVSMTVDTVTVLEEDKILCANCGKHRYQHKECYYHKDLGGPCDCPKFEPKSD